MKSSPTKQAWSLVEKMFAQSWYVLLRFKCCQLYKRRGERTIFFRIQTEGREIVKTGPAGDSDTFEGQDVALWRAWTGGHVRLFLWKLEKQHRVIVRSDEHRLLYQGCRHCLGRWAMGQNGPSIISPKCVFPKTHMLPCRQDTYLIVPISVWRSHHR